MPDFTFITGNAQKLEYLQKWLGTPVKHQKIDLDEIQSLDPHAVADHKVRQAYEIVGGPVLIDDVSLVFTAMGHLPGTFIKWFIDDLGLPGLYDLAGRLEHQKATCSITYALFDGETIQYFEAEQNGTIADVPRGTNGFGWNAIFIPDGTPLTYAEMDDATFAEWNIRAHAVKKLRVYLDTNLVSGKS
jgi:non-canonical purine NTP pyrophosphatase (RdgB/HAM1 family)